MTPEQRYTLLWLTSAMTLPVYYRTERYFYDGVNRCFFTRKQLDNCGTRFLVKGHYGKPFYTPIEADLQVRLELVEDDMSEIVEIPKLNVQDKVAIQLKFMSNFPNIKCEQELLNAINRQLDDFCFVLDRVLQENELTVPMVPYWEEYKLKTVLEYLNAFTSAIGVKFIH